MCTMFFVGMFVIIVSSIIPAWGFRISDRYDWKMSPFLLSGIGDTATLDITNTNALDEFQAILAGETDLAHMTHVEQRGVLSAPHVLF